MLSAFKSRTFLLLLVVLLLPGLGCERAAPHFQLNLPYVRKLELANNDERIDPRQLQQVVDALAALFGTPDAPYMVNDPALSLDEILDVRHLEMSAGPVASDRDGKARGLYRQHCVHCHGVNGNGAGPTAAFLNPYPRDFRSGKFKFKSTKLGIRPANEDLRRTLKEGVPGTAMPSFQGALTDAEIDALIDYVKYLAIRGDVEQALIAEAAESEAGDKLDMSRSALIEEKLGEAIEKWRGADANATPVPQRDHGELQASVERGRALYYGTVANCVKCHGDTQLGDGETTNYDDWSKDFYDWGAAGAEEERAKRLSEYLALGGLPPRNIVPRNLRHGVYRGGRRPIDIFWRIHNGIEGTPMPAAPLKQSGSNVGLSENDIWDLVNYVLALPYEPMSLRRGAEPLNERPPR